MAMDSNGIEKFNAGNRAFVDEDYELSLQFYTEAIDYCASNAEYYFKRCCAYIKLEKFAEALDDAESSIKLNDKDGKVHLKKGICLVGLHKYKEAITTLEKAHSLYANDQVKTLLQQCKDHIQKEQKEEERPADENKPSEENATAELKKVELDKETEKVPSTPKIRHDWYQTETHVIVTVLIKNLKKENVISEFSDSSLSFTAKLPSGSDYCLELDLAHPIVPGESVAKVLSTKVEMKLKKKEGIRWSSLEEDNESQYKVIQPSTQNATTKDSVHKYPTSSHMHKDWDRLAKQLQEEEKNENLEGDAALNKLFKQIYSDGSDEVKRAMNKSFQESGGTVLSTNWKDVKKETVDVKPPDCMEYKKYEY